MVNVESMANISYAKPINISLKSLNTDNVVDLSQDFENILEEISVNLPEVKVEPMYMDGFRFENNKPIAQKIQVYYNKEYYDLLKEQREKTIDELESRGFVQQNNSNVWIMKALLENA